MVVGRHAEEATDCRLAGKRDALHLFKSSMPHCLSVGSLRYCKAVKAKEQLREAEGSLKKAAPPSKFVEIFPSEIAWRGHKTFESCCKAVVLQKCTNDRTAFLHPRLYLRSKHKHN